MTPISFIKIYVAIGRAARQPMAAGIASIGGPPRGHEVSGLVFKPHLLGPFK